MRAVVLLLGYLCSCLCLLVLLFIQRHMLLYGRIAHISICAYNCTYTTLIFIYALICALDWLCVVIGRLVRCLWCGCCLLWICQVVRLYMVAIAVWLIWLLYEWLLYMCLCLCVYALLHGGWCCMPMCLCICYAYVFMLVCGVVRVCVLCHVLVVYSISVLEWLGCLSYAVAGGSVLACGLPWCLYLVTYVLTLQLVCCVADIHDMYIDDVFMLVPNCSRVVEGQRLLKP